MQENNLEMKIGIITGGESGERDVSIKSAENIKKLVDFTETEVFIFPEEKDRFLNCYKNFDVVIPLIHGVGGEDGEIQLFLEEIDMPYIFSSPKAHSVGIDKKLTKEIAESLGIRVPREIVTFPLFVKPQFGGSSIASKLCNLKEELNILISSNPTIKFIMEEPIKGREFTVGIVENSNETIPLPVVEIITNGEFFDFDNKYDPNKLATEVCPAEIEDELTLELQKHALLIHRKIDARHISRSDFIVTPLGEIYFLEINTIPGMTETSLIPKMVDQAGISLGGLLQQWCS